MATPKRKTVVVSDPDAGPPVEEIPVPPVPEATGVGQAGLGVPPPAPPITPVPEQLTTGSEWGIGEDGNLEWREWEAKRSGND